MRSCGSNGRWATPVVANCSSYGYGVLTALMQEVMYVITSGSYVNAMSTTREIK